MTRALYLGVLVAVRLTVVVLLGVLLLTAPPRAADLAGTITSSLYLWDTGDEAAQDRDHARFYTTLVTDFLNLGSDQVSFHGQYYVATDLAATADHTRTRIVRTYLKWKPDGSRGELALGRIFVSGGLLPTTIDGVSGNVRFGRSMSVYGCAGATVPVTESPELGDWEDSNFLGASLRGIEFLKTSLGLGFWRRTNRRNQLPDSSAWSDIVSDDLAEQTFFLEGSSRPTEQVGARFTIQYDEPQSRLRKAHVRVPILFRDKFQAEPYYLYRRPYIDANSIFSAFPQEPLSEYGLVLRRVRKSGWAALTYSYTDYYKDSANHLRLRSRCHDVSFGIGLREGYPGDGVDIDASYAARLRKNLTLRTSAMYARFKYDNMDRDKNETFSLRLALASRLARHLSLDIEGQGLSQGIRSQMKSGFIGYRYDIRLLIRLRYLFDIRGSGSS